MKKIILILMLTCSIWHNETKTDTNACPFQRTTSSSHTGTLLLASLYGAASGALCRKFERNVLDDCTILRLVNLIVWGCVEHNLLKNYIDDLKEQKISHSERSMKDTAWLLSWITYLLN